MESSTKTDDVIRHFEKFTTDEQFGASLLRISHAQGPALMLATTNSLGERSEEAI